MADEGAKTVLCIPGRTRNYAVEFPFIEELCKDMIISLIPCLPKHFSGVCNYKGTIVPVIYPEKPPAGEDETGGRQMILILRHQKYYLGIQLHEEPFLALADEEERIRGPEQQENGFWVEKAYYMWNNRLFSLIDVEKTLERLVIYE